jgi:hypothetical protein
MVLQQWGFFETNSCLRKLPSAFLFSHSFIPSSFSSWLLNHFSPGKMPCSVASWIHVFPTTASPFFKLTLYCSVSHNWHSEFHDIQIDRRTCALVGSTLLNAWAVLQVHSCTCALLSRHRPNASPFHTQKLVQLRIPARRSLHWTSVVPWPSNSTVTSAIYKFATILRSYPLLYYSAPIMPSSMVYIFALKTSEKYNLTVGFSHI